MPKAGSTPADTVLTFLENALDEAAHRGDEDSRIRGGVLAGLEAELHAGQLLMKAAG